jgi:hypothetical protein
MSQAGTARAGQLFRPGGGSSNWSLQRSVPSSLVLIAGATLGALMVASVVVDRPQYYRLVFALAFASNLIIIAFRWPKAAALSTLLFLPFLALIRRLLIAEAGWTSYDPLLLVGATVALVLFARAYLIEGRLLPRDRLSKLVFALLVLTLLETFNPTGGGLLAGFGGLLFLGVPLLWFFIGREYSDRQLTRHLLYAMVVIAVGIGIYGLLQTEVGFPAWDKSWLDLGGFNALSVSGKIRAFASFASSAEYAIFLAGALTVCFAMFLHGRGITVLAMPFLAVPMFLSSGRTVFALAIFAGLLMLGLRSRKFSFAIALALVGFALTMVGAQRYVDPNAGTSNSNSDPLVSHQLGGLANPLDPNKSTLPIHWNLAVNGAREGIVHPLGHGTAVTNLAATKFGIGGSAQSSELDVANTFISLGLVGGALFLCVVFIAFRRTINAYLAAPDPARLAALGIMIVGLGQWLNGGYYALAPLLWFVIGWVTKESADVAPHVRDLR